MTIRIFTTGGTIDKQYSTKESTFVIAEPAVERILDEANLAVDFEIEPLLQKDSLDLTDDDRRLIAERVATDRHRHIVITHGTDTMVDTAKAIPSCCDKTVVLTGAMQPAICQRSDAPFNIGAAFLAAQILPPGVYVAMNGQIFDPYQAAKNAALDRFEPAPGASRGVVSQ